MKRLGKLWSLPLVVFGLALGTTASAQTFSHTQLNDNLYMMTTGLDILPEYMNNLVYVDSDGVLLVDNLDAGMYPLFREGLEQITPEPVDILINTHWHHDHTSLNADFVINEGTGSIIAHHRTGAFLAEEQYLEDPDMTFPALPPEAH